MRLHRSGDDPRMQRRLVIPNLGIEPMPLETKRCLRQLKTLVSPNLDSRPQRNEALDDQKTSKQESKDDGWNITALALNGWVDFFGLVFCTAA